MLSRLIPSGMDKDHFFDRWRASRTVRDRLLEIFNSKIEDLIEDDEDVEDMSDPNWALRQAFKRGQRKAYRDVNYHLKQEV